MTPLADVASDARQDPTTADCITSSSTPPSSAVALKINHEQQRACDLITWHLNETLAGRNPRPLRMVVYGEGGTGQLPTAKRMHRD